MAIYPKKLKPARIWPDNSIQAIRLGINQTTPDAANGVVALTQGVPKHIGTIPAGAFVVRSNIQVVTAFTASVTLDVGTEVDPDGIITSAGAAPQATGWKTPVTGALIGRTSIDLPIFVLIGGAVPAAGVAEILIEFYTAKD